MNGYINVWIDHHSSTTQGYNPNSPQKVSPHLYNTGTPYAYLPGGRERGSLKSAKTSKTSKTSKTAKPLKQSRQNSRHFKAVDSELMGCETSKHVS